MFLPTLGTHCILPKSEGRAKARRRQSEGRPSINSYTPKGGGLGAIFVAISGVKCDTMTITITKESYTVFSCDSPCWGEMNGNVVFRVVERVFFPNLVCDTSLLHEEP